MMINRMSAVAMYVGAALQHPLPECNGVGPSSTIKVSQYKTKFSDVRIYCQLAHSVLVKSYWNISHEGEPTEKFIADRLFYDAQHYRDCHMPMKYLLTDDEWLQLKNPANYFELLHDNMSDFDKHLEFASENTVQYLCRTWKVNNVDELRKYFSKIYRSELPYRHAKNSVVHRHTSRLSAR